MDRPESTDARSCKCEPDLNGRNYRCRLSNRVGMRNNWNLSIVGNVILLVPYRYKFVAKYHSWMKDPFLLESTASEPLSLDEEYEMQRLWRADPKKCTFIVLARPCDEISSELDCMAGDVNLFMNDRDDKFNAEIEVMIADPRHRRHGFASEALKLMIHYATTQLEMTRFFAKIGAGNPASIALFKSLSFREVNYVKAFDEYEYELIPTSSDTRQLILGWGAHSVMNTNYDHEADEDAQILKSEVT